MQRSQWRAGDGHPVQLSLLKSVGTALACKAGPGSLHRCAEQLAVARAVEACLLLASAVQQQVSAGHSAHSAIVHAGS